MGRYPFLCSCCCRPTVWTKNKRILSPREFGSLTKSGASLISFVNTSYRLPWWPAIVDLKISKKKKCIKWMHRGLFSVGAVGALAPAILKIGLFIYLLALAFFPAIAISCWWSFLQFAFVAFMADPGTFSTAAEAVGKATSPAFKNILEKKLWFWKHKRFWILFHFWI